VINEYVGMTLLHSLPASHDGAPPHHASNQKLVAGKSRIHPMDTIMHTQSHLSTSEA
jgi:hypothetical protein